MGLTSRFAAGICAIAIALTAADTQKASALDKTTLESYVRHLFVWGPQIAVKISDPKPAPMAGFLQVGVTGSAGGASQQEVFYVSKDGRHVIRGAYYDVAQNPFKPELDKLKTDLQPSLGTPGASVVLVLFSDFQCSYCREESKMLRTNLLSAYPKDVRLYFKDFPLDQIHPWARPAAIGGRCVFRQNAGLFWDYHDWTFEHQNEITAANLPAKVQEWAKGKDLDALQLARCIEKRETEGEINKSVAEGQLLGINSTPSVFVNGRRMMGQVPWPNLRQVIDYEIEYQKTHKNAGENCGCELKLPSPLGN